MRRGLEIGRDEERGERGAGIGLERDVVMGGEV